MRRRVASEDVRRRDSDWSDDVRRRDGSEEETEGWGLRAAIPEYRKARCIRSAVLIVPSGIGRAERKGKGSEIADADPLLFRESIAIIQTFVPVVVAAAELAIAGRQLEPSPTQVPFAVPL